MKNEKNIKIKKDLFSNMSKNENKERIKFVHYLDSMKKKKKIEYPEMLDIIRESQYDFFRNKYYSNDFVGDTVVQLFPPSSKFTDKETAAEKTTSLDTAKNPPINRPRSPPYPPPGYAYSGFYEMYGPSNQIHCFDNGLFKPIADGIREPKKKVEIDAKIEGLSDLIQIVEKFSYKETEEYNIDLKSLCNIKNELIELNQMVGMEKLKDSIVHQLLYFIQELHIGKSVVGEGEKKTTHEFKHTVLMGPPGTGKTEVAKIIGKMYSKIGILSKNIFKKVTRNDLIAGYLGQTAIKTKNVINECLGGVLFIDEAYSLGCGMDDKDIYSKECIDTLCEALSDHKENIMVIIAGYESELNDHFFSMNRGLESRFIWRFHIDDYTPFQLCEIFKKKVRETDWELENEMEIDGKWFEKNKKDFVYLGRDMELLFTYTKIAHSKRIYGKSKDLRKKINIEDLNMGFEHFLKNKKKKKDYSALYSMYV
jgi:hypothetical protein